MNFSHKLDAFEASIFTELLEAKLALRAKGMDTIDLSIGTPDLPPPAAGVVRSTSAVDIESKRLFDVIKKSRFQYRSTSVLSGQILSLAESYYLLNAKHPYRCVMLAQELVLNLFYQRCPDHWYQDNLAHHELNL